MSADGNPKSLRLEWIDPGELSPNGLNFRTHPPEQVAAIAGVIEEVGWAGALLYNERTKRLIDGHARRDLFAGKGPVPVLVGEWSEGDEAKILATLDPTAAMAGTDAAKLDALLREVQTGNEAVAAMLDNLAHEAGLVPAPEPDGPAGVDHVPEKYQILIEFADEAAQAAWLEKLTAEGLNCRSLIA